METSISTSSKWKPDDKGRQILLKLKEASHPNEALFARDFTIYSPSAWSKILAAVDPDRARSYFDDLKSDDARNGLLGDLEDLVVKLPRLKAEREKTYQTKIFPLLAFQAVVKSVKQCKVKANADEPNPERIIKVVASTGGGKTTLRKYLVQELRGEMFVAAVQCRDAWRPNSHEDRRRAKFAVLEDVFEAMGLRITKSRDGIKPMEDALIQSCKGQARVLFIDEGEFFSKYSLDLVKLLMNESKLIVIIACTPRAHAKWNQYYPDEADQISRRTHAVVSTEQVKSDDVGLFFPENQFEQPMQEQEFIAKEAAKFGHFSLVNRVTELLAKSTRASHREVEESVVKAQKQMAKHATVKLTK